MGDTLASDYAAFLKVDVKSELSVVEDTLDDMLTRLDEFQNLLSMVRADGSVCTDSALPKVLASKPQLEEIFGRVDRLDELVNRVDADFSRVEAAVVQAETDLSGMSSGKFKTFFKPIFFKSTPEASTRKTVRQTPTCDVESLYSTEAFFPAGQDTQEQDI